MSILYEIAVGIGGLVGLIVGIIQLYQWFADPVQNWFRLRKKKRKARKYIRLRERIDQLEKDREIESIFLSSFAKLLVNVALIGFGLMAINIHTDFDLPDRSWVPDMMTWPFDASDPAVSSYFLTLGILTVALATANLLLEALGLSRTAHSLRNIAELKSRSKEIEHELADEDFDSLFEDTEIGPPSELPSSA